MTYNEKTDDDQIVESLRAMEAIDKGFHDISSVEEFLGISHQGAKGRLNRLVLEGKLLRETRRCGGSTGEKYVYAINPNYTEPVGGVIYLERENVKESLGLLIWYRSRMLEIGRAKKGDTKFARFMAACKKVISLSPVKVDNLSDYDPENGIIGFYVTDAELFFLPRNQKNDRCLPAERPEKCFGYCKTDNKPYTILAIACLVVMKQFFPRTILQFHCNYEMIKEGVLLAEKVVPVDRKTMFTGSVDFPKLGEFK